MTWRKLGPLLLIVAAAAGGLILFKNAAAAPVPLPLNCQPEKDRLCLIQQVSVAAERLEKIQPPPFSATSALRVIEYSVSTKGNITADLARFKVILNATLNDPRGWSRLGLHFVEVPAGGRFGAVLSEASLVPSFSAGCDVIYSCTVGDLLIINQDRWLKASDAWNNDGGSLADYRNMVINHEMGHWLGHGHAVCQTPGQPAPVMMQQSINLDGCRFNPWPLDSELHAPKLGIP